MTFPLYSSIVNYKVGYRTYSIAGTTFFCARLRLVKRTQSTPTRQTQLHKSPTESTCYCTFRGGDTFQEWKAAALRQQKNWMRKQALHREQTPAHFQGQGQGFCGWTWNRPQGQGQGQSQNWRSNCKVPSDLRCDVHGVNAKWREWVEYE